MVAMQDNDGNRYVWDEILRQWVPITGAMSPAELANEMDPVLRGRYGSQVWLPAGDFAAGTGTPALGSPASRTTAWLFDASSTENVRGSWLVPATWATAKIELVWTAAAAGDVRWQVAGGWLGSSATPADDIAATEVTATTDVTTGDIVHTTVIASTAVTPGPAHLRVQRQATNVVDTLAVDAQLIGVLITRLT